MPARWRYLDSCTHFLLCPVDGVIDLDSSNILFGENDEGEERIRSRIGYPEGYPGYTMEGSVLLQTQICCKGCEGVVDSPSRSIDATGIYSYMLADYFKLPLNIMVICINGHLDILSPAQRIEAKAGN